jgi:hypothetical protein
MGHSFGLRSRILMTLLFVMVFLAGGCALFSGREAEVRPHEDTILPAEITRGILQTGTYLIRHPDGWRFVALDPESNRGIVLFGRSRYGTVEASIEEIDFVEHITREEAEELYLNELDRIGVEYEVVYFRWNLNVVPAVFIDYDDTRALSVIRVFGRRVAIVTLAGHERAIDFDETTARGLLASVGVDTGPAVSRITDALPHLHAPDGRWQWVADTATGFTITGRIDGLNVEVTVEPGERVEPDATADRSRADSIGSEDRLLYTGAGVYTARPVSAAASSVVVALDGEESSYLVTVSRAGGEDRGNLDAERIIGSDAFGELVGFYLILDEREIPR